MDFYALFIHRCASPKNHDATCWRLGHTLRRAISADVVVLDKTTEKGSGSQAEHTEMRRPPEKHTRLSIILIQASNSAGLLVCRSTTTALL